jgi:hypothetical protein
LRSKKLRKEVKENNIPFWAQPVSNLEFHSTEVQKNRGRNNGGKFRFRQKKLRHRNRYRKSILVSVVHYSIDVCKRLTSSATCTFVYPLASRYLYTRCGTFASCCYTHYIRSMRTGTFNITANVILHQRQRLIQIWCMQNALYSYICSLQLCYGSSDTTTLLLQLCYSSSALVPMLRKLCYSSYQHYGYQLLI